MKNKKIGYKHEKYLHPKKYADTKHIPAINSLVQTYTEEASKIEQPDYYVKGVALYFTYEEEAYVIYPYEINTSGEIFEILEDKFADDLYNIGAYDIFCDGMID